MRTFPEKNQSTCATIRYVPSIRIVSPANYYVESTASTPRVSARPATQRSNHLHNMCSTKVAEFRHPPTRINDGAGHDQVLCGGGPSVAMRGLRTTFAGAESPSKKTIRSSGTFGYSSVSRDYLLMTKS
ncbi:Hypothetical protein, putative [Bodo saltans]|uniref:Uncharacterized protein n=1 Tax=Bodo saltans TaxID=75058 RepID=A0A0S4JSF7_BODSA|nr:Hypothetical protein, putative [Bodo saltans]|eukprot:CUG92265.1 Hypothetical protein, putative [Bodo saltans]